MFGEHVSTGMLCRELGVHTYGSLIEELDRDADCGSHGDGGLLGIVAQLSPRVRGGFEEVASRIEYVVSR